MHRPGDSDDILVDKAEVSLLTRVCTKLLYNSEYHENKKKRVWSSLQQSIYTRGTRQI